MIIRVGVVDDHQLFIDGIKSILSTVVDIEVVIEAMDGLSFLDKNKEQSVDIVLSDIRMPRMDGLQLTKHLLEQEQRIKIIIVSMFDQPADIKEVIKAGAHGYLPKNIGKEKLVQVIRAVKAGERCFPKEIGIQSQSTQRAIKITKRERQIISLIAKGRTSNEIAQELSISKLTVDTHRKNIHRKLNIDSAAGLIKYALEQDNNRKDTHI